MREFQKSLLSQHFASRKMAKYGFFFHKGMRVGSPACSPLADLGVSLCFQCVVFSSNEPLTCTMNSE